MNPFVKSSLLLMLCALLSGCWSKIEINDRNFITSAYVDLSDRPGEIELTVMSPLPNRLGLTGQTQNGGKGRPFATVTKSGKTLPEAFQNIQSDMTRKLTWGQTRAVVVSQAYAERGINELLEWAARRTYFPLKTFLFIAPGKAKDFTNLTPIFEQTPSEILREFANQHTLLDTQIKDVLFAINAKQGTAITLLSLKSSSLVSEGGKKGSWAGIGGAALMDKDKMVGTLPHEDAVMIAWALGSLENPYFSFQMDEGNFSFAFYRLKTRIQPRVQDGRISYRISLAAQAGLEQSKGPANLNEAGIIRRLEQQMNAKIAADMRTALRKTQKAGADVLQLGSYLDWYYPKTWEQVKERWPQVYAGEVKFDVDVSITFKRYNSESTPFWTTG
ncbi:Ger(x)C family spore germination protein [Paenibacillus filicis]|uniref:Ger(X)C family spore germination protein n=1 Tax=Paenibacillus filicis TaxID=669464 RepID=A0ABU9DE30_9BACL